MILSKYNFNYFMPLSLFKPYHIGIDILFHKVEYSVIFAIK